MKLNELYKKVRNEQEVSLDEDFMWDAIESRLDEPKKKRRFAWLWFPVGLMIMGAYWFLINGHESIPNENTLSEKNHLRTEIPMDSSPALTSLKLDNNTLKTNEKGESIQLKNEASETDGVDRITQTKVITYPQEAIVQGNQVSNYRKTYFNIQGEKYSDVKAVSSFENVSNIPTYKSKKGIPTQSLIIYPLPNRSLSIIEREGYALHFDPMMVVKPLKNFEKLTTKASQSKNQKYEWSTSLDYLNVKSTVLEKNPLVDTWGAIHEQSKSQSSSFQLRTIMKYRGESGFGIGSGAVVRLVSEWYDTTIEETTPYEMTSDSAKYITINGIQEYSSGVLNGIKLDRTTYHTPIRRLYIDIPLEISYNRSLVGFDLELLLAYNFNVSHQYYGRSYSEGQVFLDQNALKLNGVYKNRFVNSTNIGLNVNRNLNSKTSIGLSLNYWHQLSSSVASNGTLNEHYNGFGFGLNIKSKIFDFDRL